MAHPKQEVWAEQRIFLTAFGKVEYPSDPVGKPLVTRSADLNCRLVLSHDGLLVVRDFELDDRGPDSKIQLTREQHTALLEALTNRASETIREKIWTRPARRKKEKNQ